MAWDVGVNQDWFFSFWSVPSRHEKEALHFSNVLPLFIVFGVSIVLSVMVFSMERICLKVKPPLRNDQRRGYTGGPIIQHRLDLILEETEHSGHSIYGPCFIRPKLAV